MVGLIITLVLVITWLAFEMWRAPLLKQNDDGSWVTLRKAKQLSDLFKKPKQ